MVTYVGIALGLKKNKFLLSSGRSRRKVKEKLQENVPIEMEGQEKHFLNPESEDSGNADVNGRQTCAQV